MHKRRTTAITLRVSYTKVLLVRLRRFRVSKSHRSRTNRQLVLSTNLRGIRQISVELISLSKRSKYHQPRSKHTKSHASWALVVAGLVGVVFFAWQLTKTPHLQAESSAMLPAVTKASVKSEYYSLPKSLPSSLQIPRIGVDVATSPVGRNADGSMATPGVFDAVTGWYQYGPTPGEIGPAVIVGHVDTYKGPSVFWRLHELQVSDQIKVTRVDGTVATFAVESTGQFEQDSFPTDTIYGNIPYAGLRLITCGGSFNASTGHYSQNTVIFARLLRN